ncbi:MAG: hypothetical protein ACOVMO_00670, partial [Caulobacter sp.]
MATSSANQDPFDLGFEADDVFAATSGDPWRDSPARARPAAGIADDPFADFPPARSVIEDDPYAELMRSPPQAASPVHHP